MESKHPNIRDARVTLSHHSLVRVPFANWLAGDPPVWWTANNKVKHARDKEFSRASLDSAIDAVSALLIINIYRHQIVEGEKAFVLDRAPRLFDIEWFGQGVLADMWPRPLYGIPNA